MALIPEETETIVEEVVSADETQPAVLKTYALDFTNGTIGDFIDGEAALLQYVQKALKTKRDTYAIYGEDYGSELPTLIGEDITPALLDAEVSRMVKETMSEGSLIADVTGVTVGRTAEKLYVSATVEASDGAKLRIEEVLNR